MGWWSEANLIAIGFVADYPNASQTRLVNKCRSKALRNLAFLALEIENKEAANGYIDSALLLDPKDKAAQNLRKLAAEHK